MDLIRALGELAEAPGPEQTRVARRLQLPGEPARTAYTDLFVVQLYPYASVYLGPDGKLGGPPQQRIADFWNTLGERVPRDPDHIATLFAGYALLADRAKSQIRDRRHDVAHEARHVFLWECLLSWLVPFVMRVRELGSEFYTAWATLALDALEAEAIESTPATSLPQVLRVVPPATHDNVAATFADSLFAPARSGVILTRADLHRCARDLLLPVRVADRRYTLRTLLTQDPERVAGWLAIEAERQADLLREVALPFREIATFWRARAHTTAAYLRKASTQPSLAARRED